MSEAGIGFRDSVLLFAFSDKLRVTGCPVVVVAEDVEVERDMTSPRGNACA